MADNYQFKRGTTSANAAFIGPAGSISLDEEKGVVHIHDGVTPGGSFQIQQAAQLNSETLEFESNAETYVASAGQSSFHPAQVDLTITAEISVKVDGQRIMSGWSVVGANIVFDTPMTGNETVDVSNVKKLESLVQKAAGETNVEAVIVEAIETATGAEGVTLGDVVTTKTLQVAIDSIDMTGAISSAIENAEGLGGTSLNDIITVGDRIDLGLVN